MEVLAYQHLAFFYEASGETPQIAEQHNFQVNLQKCIRAFHPIRLPCSAWMRCLSITLLIFLLAANSALANLTRGARGPAVTSLQLSLQSAGYDPGPVDGVFGAGTEAAVRRFQRDRGLAVDGVVGPSTEAALTRVGPGLPPSRGVASQSTVELQRLLSNQNCYRGAIDGVLGPGTTAGIISAQRTYGLVVDGIPGPATLAALRSARCRCS